MFTASSGLSSKIGLSGWGAVEVLNDTSGDMPSMMVDPLKFEDMVLVVLCGLGSTEIRFSCCMMFIFTGFICLMVVGTGVVGEV